LLLFLVKLRHVQRLVDVPRNGPDLCAELLLDPVQGKPVVVGDEVDRNAEVTKPAAAADPVQVSLGHLGEIEVDDNVYSLDVDAPGEEVAADEVPTQPSAEVVEDSVPVGLGHLGVDVVAGVAQLRYLLSQQFHPLCRIAEYDALVDLQFREKSVEAVDLLAFLDEGVVLRDALKSELIH